jgi:hypothetical protein
MNFHYNMCHEFCEQHDVLAEIVRLAVSVREQCFTWGAQQHKSTYDMIVDAAMMYSLIVNYAGATEIPFLLRHPESSSSSASTAASQPTPSTFAVSALTTQ